MCAPLFIKRLVSHSFVIFWWSWNSRIEKHLFLPNFLNLIIFQHLLVLSWFMKKFLHTTVCTNFHQRWENYCKIGLNKQSKNKDETKILQHFMWSRKKNCFFSVGRNFCTKGNFSTLHILTEIWKNSPQSKLHKKFLFIIIYFLKIVSGVFLDIFYPIKNLWTI